MPTKYGTGEATSEQAPPKRVRRAPRSGAVVEARTYRQGSAARCTLRADGFTRHEIYPAPFTAA
jgi:hypothetical protein